MPLGQQVFLAHFFSSTKLLSSTSGKKTFIVKAFPSSKGINVKQSKKVTSWREAPTFRRERQRRSPIYGHTQMYTSYCTITTQNTACRCSKHNEMARKKLFQCPSDVKDNNKWTEGVNNFDQKRNTYPAATIRVRMEPCILLYIGRCDSE